MRIRSRLHSVIIASIALAAVTAALVFAAARREDEASDCQSRAQTTEHEAATLLALTQQYTRYADPRVARQWRLRHQAIVAVINEEELPSIPAGPALVELRTLTQTLPSLFARLENMPADTQGLDLHRKEPLLDELLADTQAMSDDAYQWYQESLAIRHAAQREFRWVALGAPCLIMGLLLAGAAVVHRRVLLPLRRLDQAAAAIRRGDLTFRIGSNAQDELGDLAREFDAMTTTLVEAGLRRDRSEQRLRDITDNLPVLITYLDSEERYAFVNRTGREWLGLRGEVVGHKVGDCLAAPEYAARQANIGRALRGETVHFETVHVELDANGDAQERSLQYVYLPDRRPDGTVDGLYGLATDISAMKKIERRLSLLVRSDALTGLANRYQFNEQMPQALARARRASTGIALMYLDIDRFKAINDTLGHAAGDAVLQEFAQRLSQSVRVTDSVVRLGGDEFAVILEGLHNDEEPQFVARKIIANVTRPLEIAGRSMPLSTSIGVAFCRHVGDVETGEAHAQRLLLQADEALYAAKNGGRNTFRLLVDGNQPAPFESTPA
ncbi:MAG TPA: diguanylate cyclase [Burkholderiaceae bacterium]|nr:diguanylate cyclase [Burkholderiaceae bacterium]